MGRAFQALCTVLAVTCLSNVGVQAHSIEGHIQVAARESASVTISLNGGKHTTLSRRDGSFVFHNLPAGVYMVETYSTQWVFGRYLVTVASSGKTKAVEFAYPGAEKATTSYPLQIKAQTVPVYFQTRVPFNPLSYLKNPMVLIMLVVCAMMFIPKLMGEETMEEIRKQQEEQGGLAGAFGIKLPQEADSDDSDEETDAPQTGSQRRAAARAAAGASGQAPTVAARRPKRGKRGKRA